MISIPLLATPAQTFQIVLGNQDCRLALYQRGESLYSDLDVAGVAVWRGTVCLNLVGLKTYGYLPFRGELFFCDMEGDEDPRAEGLGVRWPLLFLDESEAWPAALQKRGLQ